MTKKSNKEVKISEFYKKWLHQDNIPQHILDNFRIDTECFKKRTTNKQTY